MSDGVHDEAIAGRRLRAAGATPEEVRRFRNAFYKKGVSDEDALALLPERAAREARSWGLHVLDVESRHDSGIDGATKLVLSTSSGSRIETVILRITTGRVSLCVSSQVGCAADCAFCATGRMGLLANLSADEIVDQVVVAQRALATEGRRARNIVFMGMGEPLHNAEAVSDAIDVLVSPRSFAHSPGRILVSTVGVPGAMSRFARRHPRVRMAVSLHSAREDVRAALVPLARRHSLAELGEAIDEVARIGEQRVMIEYLLLRGVNDGPDDLEALAAWASGRHVHVNLIPFNPIDDARGLEATPPDERLAFSAALKGRGFPVTLRYSLGRDIEAACGQLVRRRRAESEA